MISFRLSPAVPNTYDTVGAIYTIMRDLERNANNQVVFKRLQSNTQAYVDGPHATGIMTAEDGIAPDCFSPRMPLAAIASMSSFIFSGTFYMSDVFSSNDVAMLALDLEDQQGDRTIVPFLFVPRAGMFILLFAEDTCPGLEFMGGPFRICRCRDPFEVAARYKRVFFTASSEINSWTCRFVKNNGSYFMLTGRSGDGTAYVNVAEEQQADLYPLLSTAVSKLQQLTSYMGTRKVAFSPVKEKPIKEADLDAALNEYNDAVRHKEPAVYSVKRMPSSETMFIDYSGRVGLPNESMHAYIQLEPGTGKAHLYCAKEDNQSLELAARLWFGRDVAEVDFTTNVVPRAVLPTVNQRGERNLFSVLFSNSAEASDPHRSAVYNEQRYMRFSSGIKTLGGDPTVISMAMDLTTGNLFI